VPVTDAELAEIEARWAKATPGPWGSGDPRFENVFPFNGVAVSSGGVAYAGKGEDWQAFRAAHADNAALLAEVKRLRAPAITTSVMFCPNCASSSQAAEEAHALRRELAEELARLELKIEALHADSERAGPIPEPKP
jgi:hypothetical protein